MTEWSKQTSEKFPKQWVRSSAKLIDCFYDRIKTDRIVCYDEQYLCVINKNEPMPGVFEKIFTQQLNSDKKGTDEQSQSHAIHLTDKYRVMFVIQI